jgi:hypothetical protein
MVIGLLLFVAFGAAAIALGYRAARNEEWGRLLVEQRIPGWVRDRDTAVNRYRKLVAGLLIVVGTAFVVIGVAILVSVV